jgi:hypothetical protein
MDLACGPLPGEAPKQPGEDNRPIVCVQLPAAVTDDTSGASLDTYVVDGIRYILDQADAIARSRGCARLPVVINLSYGTIAGRHDGTSDIELAIAELIAAREGSLQVVLPAGNGRLERCHARIAFAAAGASKTLQWRLLPDDRTTSHLEIWLPRGAPTPGRVALGVRPPGGQGFERSMREGEHAYRVWGEWIEESGGAQRLEGRCYVRYCHVPAPTDRGMFLVTINPTAPEENPTSALPTPAAAPQGVWTIELQNLGLDPSQEVHAWIQRDDASFGRSSYGRQSYFEDEHYVRYGADGNVPEHDDEASQVKRAGTLNGITGASEVILVGGFRRQDRRPADFSGEGWSRAPEISDDDAVASKLQPDASTPSDDSLVHRGILAAGTRSGSVVALSGTSVAAPQVTRIVADRLAKGLPAGPDAIARLAQQLDSGAGVTGYPHTRLGAGRIDPYRLAADAGGVIPVAHRYETDDERETGSAPKPPAQRAPWRHCWAGLAGVLGLLRGQW